MASKAPILNCDTASLRVVVDFSNMEEDSFYHLKRLVQYNNDDPDKIDTELATPFEGC